MNGTEKSKYDNDNDMDISLELTTNIIQQRKRPLDAIYINDDDMDETKSIIWVQCRKCKCSCPVETYIVGEYNCTWGAEKKRRSYKS